ncbi:hypothetical protein ACFCV3_11485 [Kribbella sp. NPDC056345]|uniref:hypothetical protein n=1 Tax=Kribbella sp. NPDC056345 TaxID=3345789 RepID=UPI0035E05C0A
MATAAALVAVLPLSTQALPVVAAGPDATPARFAAEVRSAGLSTDEQKELQRAVNAELAKRGGHQVAANKILWADGGAATTIPYPSERKARALGASMGIQGDPATCSYGYFCVYANVGYNGARTDFYNCRVYSYYDDFWSYVNNQSDRAAALMYWDQPGGGPDVTPQAWHAQYTWQGLNYSGIKPC